MQTLFYTLIISLAILSSCNSGSEKTATSENDTNYTVATKEAFAKLQFLYFHGERQCPSCIAIGEETRKILKEQYQGLVDAGEMAFREINVDEEINFAIAEKYQIAGSALLLVKTIDGKEEISDLTGDGFKLAKNMPDMFKEKVKTAIDNFLK